MFDSCVIVVFSVDEVEVRKLALGGSMVDADRIGTSTSGCTFAMLDEETQRLSLDRLISFLCPFSSMYCAYLALRSARREVFFSLQPPFFRLRFRPRSEFASTDGQQ